jgi:hypothetical protein
VSVVDCVGFDGECDLSEKRASSIKNHPDINSERLIFQGELERDGKRYLRRDYAGGFVELYYFDGVHDCWVVEGYRHKDILGMPYDFECCLSSPVLYGLYLESVRLMKDKKRFPTFDN